MDKELIEKRIKEGNLVEKYKKGLFDYYKEEGITKTPEEIFDIMIEGYRDMCPYNVFGICWDYQGDGLNIELKDLEEYFGEENLSCEYFCKHGFCAKVNKLALGPLHKLMYNKEDEDDD